MTHLHVLFSKNEFQILDRKKEIACCEKNQQIFGI